jgi:hypothetical protein
MMLNLSLILGLFVFSPVPLVSESNGRSFSLNSYAYQCHYKLLHLMLSNFLPSLSFISTFQPAIPASKRLLTHALDRAAPGIGTKHYLDEVIH